MRFRLLVVAVIATLAIVAALGDRSTFAQDEPMTIGLELVSDGLTSPVALVPVPDDTGRNVVVDQSGVAYVITADDERLEDPFIDVRDRMVPLNPGFDERGLLGLAFHPDFTSNGRLFVYYSAPLRPSAPAGFNHTSHISEFAISDNPNGVDMTSESILLQVDEPQLNHNAGTLAFSPADGYLYISLGDGGGANDVGLGHVEDWYPDNGGGNGQDITSNLLGSILRIDVDAGEPYAIPPDNPFVGESGLDEIWAFGFRNPYRFSFDMAGGHRLFVGDAGQALWEEVSIATSGGNFGWNVKEGTHCFDAENPTVVPASCPDVDADGRPLIDPVIEYANARQPGGIGRTVIGGHVYRGDSVPQLRGRYVFGDWSTSFGTPDGTLLLAKERKKGL